MLSHIEALTSKIALLLNPVQRASMSKRYTPPNPTEEALGLEHELLGTIHSTRVLMVSGFLQTLYNNRHFERLSSVYLKMHTCRSQVYWLHAVLYHSQQIQVRSGLHHLTSQGIATPAFSHSLRIALNCGVLAVKYWTP